MPNTKIFFKRLAVIVPASLILFAGGCATLRVRTDYSHTTDFAQYHTYSWLKVSAPNSLWSTRIRRDVNEQLAMKGWMEVPSGGQAAVTAFSATRERPTLETFYESFGPGFGGWYWGGWGWGGFGGEGIATTQTVYTPIGSLVTDIFNSSTKHLIWRGMATQALSDNPRKNEQKLENAVAKMFRNFPPPSRG